MTSTSTPPSRLVGALRGRCFLGNDFASTMDSCRRRQTWSIRERRSLRCVRRADRRRAPPSSFVGIAVRCGGGDPATAADPSVVDGRKTTTKQPAKAGMLEEVSTGGQQQRRWARAADGRSFDRLPPTRPHSELDDAWSWDPRQSPRLRAIFLPAGYPDTVSPDYAPFIRWHLGSLVFRNVLEVLTAQSLLVALGMGSTPGALPLTAATKWVLKDGVGSFATLFAGSLGGQRYDEDPKRWWAVTNLLEDVARALELITPLYPGLFLPLAASATFVRFAALTGRGSLMNGTFMQHLGRNRNLGDVRAKLEVQGRWLALVALPVGIGIFRYVSTAFGTEGSETHLTRLAPLGAYGVVVGGHALCCWRAAAVLRFDTLNRHRLLRAAAAYVADGAAAVPTVEETGEAEGVYRARVVPGMPTLGASLPDAAKDWEDLERLVDVAVCEEREAEATGRVAGGEDGHGSRTGRGRGELRRRFVLGWDAARGAPAVLLDAGAGPADVIAASLAAASFTKYPYAGDADASTLAAAYAYADQHADAFEAALVASEWRTDFVQMGTAPRYRLAALVR